MTKLVCLPFAGAGASFYRSWSSLCGSGLDVVAVQLPGRERRIDEAPHTDVHEAVAELAPAVLEQAVPDERMVLFGHSLGAVLAFELAHRLLAGGVEVAHLFVSGSPGPRTPREERATGLDDDRFIDRVAEFAGVHHAALANPEVRELVLPTLRADVRMHEDYRPRTTDPLPVPVTALRGRDDGLVDARRAREWALETTRGFDLVELDGGHMYLVDAAEPVLEVVQRQLVATGGVA